MILAMVVKNYLNEEITIKLDDPEPAHGLIIKDITGLGAPKATIGVSNSVNDGGFYSSSRVEKRTIGITFLLSFCPDIEIARRSTYKYFPIKQKVKLTFITDKKSVWIEGYVESNEPNIFSKDEEVNISIVCDNPYFCDVRDVNNFDLIFSSFGEAGGFEFPFSDHSNEAISDGRKLLIEYWDGDEEYVNKMSDEEIIDEIADEARRSHWDESFDARFKKINRMLHPLSFGDITSYYENGLFRPNSPGDNTINYIDRMYYNDPEIIIDNPYFNPSSYYYKLRSTIVNEGDINTGFVLKFSIRNENLNKYNEIYNSRSQGISTNRFFLEINNQTMNETMYISLVDIARALSGGNNDTDLPSNYDGRDANLDIEISTISAQKYILAHGYGDGYDSDSCNAIGSVVQGIFYDRTDIFANKKPYSKWITLNPGKNSINLRIVESYYAKGMKRYIIESNQVTDSQGTPIIRYFEDFKISYNIYYQGV